MTSPTRAAVAWSAALALAAGAGAASAQTPAPAWTAPAGTLPPAPPPAYPPNLQAGGLTPPPSTTTTATPPNGVPPGSNQTEQDLEKAKKEDSKRGLEWVWLNAEGGFSHVDMETFVGDKDFTLGFVPTQSVGGVVGLGLGVRLLFLTIGARGRVGFYDPWQMFTVGGEIGLHIPLGRLDPHFEVGGGYAALGSVSGLVKGASDAISISGGYGRISGGLDVYVTPVFSLGLQASGDFLALVRQGLTPAQIQTIRSDPSLTSAQSAAADGLGLEGSSYGTAVGVTGVLGLHF